LDVVFGNLQVNKGFRGTETIALESAGTLLQGDSLDPARKPVIVSSFPLSLAMIFLP